MFDNETNRNYDNVKDIMDLFDLDLYDQLNLRNRLFHVVDHMINYLIGHLINESLKEYKQLFDFNRQNKKKHMNCFRFKIIKYLFRLI
jgi:hypothetical protein